MKQPLMLMPPAQAEVLSDNVEDSSARNGTQSEERFPTGLWLDDDLLEEAMLSPGLSQAEDARFISRPHRRAA